MKWRKEQSWLQPVAVSTKIKIIVILDVINILIGSSNIIIFSTRIKIIVIIDVINILIGSSNIIIFIAIDFKWQLWKKVENNFRNKFLCKDLFQVVRIEAGKSTRGRCSFQWAALGSLRWHQLHQPYILQCNILHLHIILPLCSVMKYKERVGGGNELATQ